jgi:hypothetical protein
MPAGAFRSCAGRTCAPAGHPGGLGTRRHTEHLEQRPVFVASSLGGGSLVWGRGRSSSPADKKQRLGSLQHDAASSGYNRLTR